MTWYFWQLSAQREQISPLVLKRVWQQHFSQVQVWVSSSRVNFFSVVGVDIFCVVVLVLVLVPTYAGCGGGLLG